MASEVSRLTRDEFVKLVERHNEELLRLAFAMSGDRALAEDAVQSCWQAAWRAHGDIRDQNRMRAWLFTVTANQVRRGLRRRRLAEIVGGRLTPRDRPDPFDARHIDLTSGLSRLKPDDRELLALRYGLGLTSEEIGDVLGLSASGVRRRLQRVVGRLRTELGDA